MPSQIIGVNENSLHSLLSYARKHRFLPTMAPIHSGDSRPAGKGHTCLNPFVTQ